MANKKFLKIISLKELLIFLVILISGAIYVAFILNDTNNQYLDKVLQIARSIEASLPKDELKTLPENIEDLQKQNFDQLKKSIQKSIKVNTEARFAYVYVMRNDRYYFLADSEPESSPDYSGTGQDMGLLFDKNDPMDRKLFYDGKELVTKPVTDRWGTWVSAQIPVKDEKTGQMIAAFGMDYNAKSWKNRILFEVAKSVLMVFIILILAFVSSRSMHKNILLKKEISQREKAEKELKENELTLSNLIGNLPGMVYRCALDDKYTMKYMSEPCFRITGYLPDDFIGNKTISFNDLIVPEYRQPIREKWQKIMDEKSFFEDEYPILTASGETKWIWERGGCIFDENGNLQYLEGYIEDVTEDKKREAELIKAKEKAEESDRLKSAFLANISHEIRTPMNGILGFADLLKTPDLSSENQQEFIEVIEKSGQRMLNIINDLMDISKIEAGETSLKIQKTNVNKMLQEIHLFFMPEVNLKNIHLDYHCPLHDKESDIETDSTKLNQILTNLIRNAVKFTSEGSITFGYKLKDSKFEFYVSDTGPGIEPDQKDLIFERFRQGSRGHTRRHEGAGLGLSISKVYVELLGGKIWVKSELGKGSTFFFELPYPSIT